MNHLILKHTHIKRLTQSHSRAFFTSYLFLFCILLLNRLERSGNSFCYHQWQQNKWWLSCFDILASPRCNKCWKQGKTVDGKALYVILLYSSKKSSINISLPEFLFGKLLWVRFLMSPFKFKSPHKIEHYMPYKISTQPELENIVMLLICILNFSQQKKMKIVCWSKHLRYISLYLLRNQQEIHVDK